tara:strand:+ start:222 stop:482 length:261 start_codon:yes stop_codon:yes gene_type:complete
MKGFLTRKQIWRKTKIYNLHEYKEEPYKNTEDKGVHFNNIVSVVLIPQRKELSQFLGDKLWYSQDDYFGFVKDRDQELFKSKYNSF